MIANWRALDMKTTVKIFESPVGKVYDVALLLTNCVTCCYGNEVCSKFLVAPPTMSEYLSGESMPVPTIFEG